MQCLQDQVLILQVSNLVYPLIISWSYQLFLCLNFNSHLFQTSTIILSNIIESHSGHRFLHFPKTQIWLLLATKDIA